MYHHDLKYIYRGDDYRFVRFHETCWKKRTIKKQCRPGYSVFKFINTALPCQKAHSELSFYVTKNVVWTYTAESTVELRCWSCTELAMADCCKVFIISINLKLMWSNCITKVALEIFPVKTPLYHLDIGLVFLHNTSHSPLL